MHINMALLLNICKFNGCAQIFPNLEDLIHHIEETHIIANEPQIPERSQPACLPLSCILPYNPPCDTVAPSVATSGVVNGTDTMHHNTGSSMVSAAAAVGAALMTNSGGSFNNQSSDMVGNGTTTPSNVNCSTNGMIGASVNGTATVQNCLTAVAGGSTESAKNHLNQTTGTTDLKRKIAIKHHSYSISSSNRSTTPTGSEMDDDEMMVSESEDSNDSWTTEEFSSEFIMRYGSRRHSSSSTANGTNSSNEKPFACPVPGCKKRYKNVNGIKYHSKNGHKKDGNRVRKGYKCVCGKSYKTNQRFKIHNMFAHGPGWPNVTAVDSASAPAVTSANSVTPSRAAASEGDVSVAAFETIPLASSVSLPAPATPNQTHHARGSSSSASAIASASHSSSVNFSSTWDSNFTLDFNGSDTSGTNSHFTNEHDPIQDQASQIERSCSSTSNSNSSSSSGASSNANRSGSSISIMSNSSLNSTVYANGSRSVLHITNATLNTSSQNGTTTTSSSPPPQPSTTILTTAITQSGVIVAAHSTPKRTTTMTTAALMISPIQPSHSINSTGCYTTSTSNSSPVSIKYDSLGILTPATSPKLIAAGISPDNGQVLASAAGSTPVSVVSPRPDASDGAMSTLNVNVTGGTGGNLAPISAANGGSLGIAMVVSSIDGCGENNTNSTITTTNSNNNAIALSASSATSQLYAEET